MKTSLYSISGASTPLSYPLSKSILWLSGEILNRVNTPAGTLFSATNYILPEIIENLLEARSAAKKDNNPYLSQAIKILMNSFYGVLGAKDAGFFRRNSHLPSPKQASTSLKPQSAISPHLLHNKVIYGDTDSLFVLLGPGFEKKPTRTQIPLNRDYLVLSEHLKETFNVNSSSSSSIRTIFAISLCLL
jgi:DNA polymerase-2